jgi:hypothetical protein
VAGQTPPAAPATAAFKNPLVPPKQKEVAQTEAPAINSSALGLIQPTNPKQRLILVAQSEGRPDPFARINPPVAVDVPITVAVKPVPKLPPLPTIKNPIVAFHPKPKLKPKPITIVSVLPKKIPPVIPIPKLTPILPPPPEPNTAKAVTVTGVLLIGNEPEAIIKVPNEPTSRYVQAGQRLLDGVLVKRIEMNQGSSPLVVFEQYGIEVNKAVGEKPITDSNNNDNTNTKPSTSPV